MADTVSYNESAEFLLRDLPEDLRKPKVAIICGSGLGGLADSVRKEGKVEFDYASIPGFPRSTGMSKSGIHQALLSDLLTTTTVEGHAGKLVFGFLSDDIPAVLMVGRFQ